jgi:hypothetical protein
MPVLAVLGLVVATLALSVPGTDSSFSGATSNPTSNFLGRVELLHQ